MSKLIIIESPSKAPAIMAYLGKEYKVLASKGHVRDLPKSSLGVAIDDGFKPKYITIQGKSDIINVLKKEAKAADAVYFATDPDREGEAISWHLATVLGIEPEKCRRVTFNEITKSTVQAEIKKPRQIDMNLVDAQQARRVLDRIVGYQLSPYLWKTIKSGLSAGRVQSVAARLIVERDAEIDAFVPKEYHTIDAELKTSRRGKVTARFYGDKAGKIELSTKEEADAIISACDGKLFTADSVKKSRKAKSPLPPFETATLQQDASRRLGFPSKKIMRVAQELYEGVDLGKELGGTHGVITYMRTDSLRISDEASAAARTFIVKTYGKENYPPKPRFFKSKESAQDAHEAIRPADVNLTPEMLKGKLSSDQYKLYKLIWERFVASQMKNAEIDTTSVDFSCGDYVFKSNESSVAFKGYLAVYDDTGDDEAENDGKLSGISEGEKLDCESITEKQNFTEPPARYTEGSLVKILKEKGIGRPSTYAQTITTIIDRGYVTLEKKVFKSTPLGKATVELMKKNFPKIVDYKFTANVETSLDKIADGEESYTEVLSDFYGGFEKTLSEAQKHLKENRVKIPDEESDIICEKCGRKMVIKTGRYGKFAACPGYPECKNTKPLDEKKRTAAPKAEPEQTDVLCDKCGAPMVIRTSKFGKFYACTAFPKCRNTKAIREEIGVACPKCGAPIVKGHGKKNSVFYSCSRYPECDFSMWDRPTDKKCPECGSMLALKESKGVLVCTNKECKYKEEK